MKLNRSILLYLLFFLPAIGAAKEWVYMGYYPYLYDFDSGSWLYSTPKSLRVYDMSTQEWSIIGESQSPKAPDDATGLTLTLCESSSCWEGFYHGYIMGAKQRGEFYYWGAMLGGLVPEAARDVRYEYERISNTRAVVTFVSIGTEGAGGDPYLGIPGSRFRQVHGILFRAQ